MAPQKSGKGSPPRQEPTNIQPHPEWEAMQAYYGPGVPMTLPPYMSSPMMPGHPPHQMWGPAQGVMPPYGVPYQAVYPPGVVYAHPHPAVPIVGTPGNTPQQSKISETKDRGSTKKVKRLETISTQVSTDVAEVDDEDSSWSQDQAIDAPCDYGNPKAKFYKSVGTGFTFRIETGDVAATVVKAVKAAAVGNGCCGGVLGKLKVTFK